MAKSQRTQNTPLSGFFEDRHEFAGIAPAIHSPALDFQHAGNLTIGQGGRVLIPADIRSSMGVDEGDDLIASLADGELRLMSGATAIARAQAIVRLYVPEGSPSMVDELIAERRRENEMDSQ
jgi:antitoxin PrlF